MTQCDTLNVKLSSSQFNKLESGTKNVNDVTLNLSSNVVGESNYETNFLHKLLLTNRQFSKFHKALANVLSTNIKFSKGQLSTMIQLGGFLIPLGFGNPLFDKMNNLFLSLYYKFQVFLIKFTKKSERILRIVLDARYNLLYN